MYEVKDINGVNPLDVRPSASFFKEGKYDKNILSENIAQES